MIEFVVVDPAIKENGQLVLRGFVNTGDVTSGCEFRYIFDSTDESANLRQETSLVVQGMIAYGRSLDILSQGMSGELHLVGDIDISLHERDVLRTATPAAQ